MQEIKEGFKQLWKLFKTVTLEELVLTLLNRFQSNLEYAERIKKATEEADNFIIKRNRFPFTSIVGNCKTGKLEKREIK